MKTPSPEWPEGYRRAYQEWVGLRGTPERTHCPNPDQILDLAGGRSEESGRLEILDHVMQCEDCRRELDLLRTVEEAKPQRIGPVPGWMAAAASVAILFGAGYGLWSGRGEGEAPALRGTEDVVILLSPPSGGTEAETVRFYWTSAPGAVAYVFELLSEEGTTLFTRVMSDTVLSLDFQEHPEVRGNLVWWVRARGQDGVERGSETRALEVPPR